MLLLLQRTRELCEISFGDHMSKRFESTQNGEVARTSVSTKVFLERFLSTPDIG